MLPGHSSIAKGITMKEFIMIFVLPPLLLHIILLMCAWNRIMRSRVPYRDGILTGAVLIAISTPIVGSIMVTIRSGLSASDSEATLPFVRHRKKEQEWAGNAQELEARIQFLEKENTQLNKDLGQ